MKQKLKLFDIAANLTDDQFKGKYHGKHHHQPDIDEVIKRSNEIGCEHLLIASGNLSDLKESIKLCALSENYYTTAGVHPCRAAEYNPNYWNQLLKYRDEAFQQKKLIAIGECGLDYDRLEWSTKQQQYQAFIPHFEWADKLKLPLYLHNRNTGDDFYNILQEHKHQIHGGVVHSFTGKAEELEKILKFDLFVGVNGCSLKTEENIQAALQIPLNKLLLETDSPYCEIRNTHTSMKYVKTQFPSQKHEKYKQGNLVKSRNEPCKIVQVLEIMASLHKIDENELAQICFENTLKCFNLLK